MNTIAPKTSLPTGRWCVDRVHSQLVFAVDYIVGTFRGHFHPIQVCLDVEQDGSASLVGSAPVAGIQVRSKELACLLQSPQFFNEDAAPEIRFRSTRIATPDAAVAIDGELAVAGRTLPVHVTGTLSPQVALGGRTYLGLHLDAYVDRRDFGITLNPMLSNGKQALADRVLLRAELYLVKA